jgi:multiple antibiotic resistance protein
VQFTPRSEDRMQMLEWAEYTKFFLALLVIVNPLGAVPVFVSMTPQAGAEEKRHIALVASISVAIVLIVAAIGGQPLLAFFGITIASFKVGGAILILLLAISMMHATPTGEKQTPEEAKEAVEKESIAVVPLAVPLLSGPGAISTTIIYATERSSLAHIGIIIGCCLLISLTTWGALRVATPVSRWLGKTGVNIAIRIMGLLLAAVAVEIFTSGLLVLLPGLG